MRDLTKGPVSTHVLQLATFIALTTFFQTLYFIVDLYFVGRLGKEAIAGVGLAGNLTMVVLALTQSLGVGATSLIAQNMGRRDKAQAERLFNQGLVLSVVVGVAFGVVAFACRRAYVSWLAADAATARFALQYLDWFIPAMGLQFTMVALGSALRGLGDVKVPTLIQVSTVLLNIVLAPVLMFGWGTGRPLGVAGTAIATFIAVVAGSVALILYFRRAASPLRFRSADWPPAPRVWWQMLRVGLPVGGEFAVIAIYMTLVYDIIQPFGAAAQAGFGIGARVMQAMFLPAVAIGFATAPVAGQNFGARQGVRVRQTFQAAAMMSILIMLALTVVCQMKAPEMVAVFNSDAAVIAFGAEYLGIVSWNFVASGLIFVISSTFQGMGNTVPALASSVLRLVVFAVPAYLLSQRAGFQMRHVWYVALGAIFVHLCVSGFLLKREFGKRLSFV